MIVICIINQHHDFDLFFFLFPFASSPFYVSFMPFLPAFLPVSIDGCLFSSAGFAD